jgi:hypothetical protein
VYTLELVFLLEELFLDSVLFLFEELGLEEFGLEDLLTITTSLFFLVLVLSSRFALLLLLPELLLVEEFLEF